ncbi:nuclear transport factor 2 family protein [Kutzneria kofuensis]|uniref:SnoaL-like domain-containing protein n=1 Tax=Kutzneria kofuensis TaxID=103725 RepID=A0A7W9KQT8_9PSEU|nr:nuclear transport factor 2 family protein [Kutzneria kofuensis]MBB5897011.1 hypothetical protein [Kutzneria kofuensis]
MTTVDDRTAVIEACTRFGWYMDIRDWDRLTGVFDDEVEWGAEGASEKQPAAALVDSFVKVFDGVDSTQHQITDHLVDVEGDTAVCTTQYRVYHIRTGILGDPVLMNAGRFRFELARRDGTWRVRAVIMTPTWSSGSMAVLGAPARHE